MSDERNFYDEEDVVEEVSDVAYSPSETKEGISVTVTESAEGTEASDEEIVPATLDLSDVDLGDLSLEVDDDDSSSSEQEDIISSEERLRLFSDQILASCVGGKEIQKYALDKLMSVTNPRLFRDENYVLFSILYAFRSKLRYINIDAEFIKLFLNRNRKIITGAREYIDIGAYGEIDGSLELGYIAGVIKHFNRLCVLPDITVEDFETYFEKYLIEFKAIEANKAYRQSQMILTEGLKIGRKSYFGFEDSQSYCKRRLAEIEGLVDMNVGSGFVRMSEVIMDEKPDGKKPVKIGDFGALEPLNKAYGGIYTGMFYSYIAPPKSGKTKLAARLCHNVAVVAGNNVTVWAQEGGHEAWTAQMRAIHFDYIYNTDVGVSDIKYGVTQETIIRDNFKSDELRQLELSSKLDLASNQNYGTIDYIDRPFNVETFLEDIDTSIKENNSQLVIIDYLQLIGSASGKNERERIAEAYKVLLTYCKKNNVAVISPAQYKQESFNDLIKRSSVDGADLRTAAGGSSEVLRTPDVLFALWATVDDIRNSSMKIISMPCRMNAAFPNVDVAIDLGTCSFIAIDS